MRLEGAVEEHPVIGFTWDPRETQKGLVVENEVYASLGALLTDVHPSDLADVVIAVVTGDAVTAILVPPLCPECEAAPAQRISRQVGEVLSLYCVECAWGVRETCTFAEAARDWEVPVTLLGEDDQALLRRRVGLWRAAEAAEEAEQDQLLSDPRALQSWLEAHRDEPQRVIALIVRAVRTQAVLDHVELLAPYAAAHREVFQIVRDLFAAAGSPHVHLVERVDVLLALADHRGR